MKIDFLKETMAQAAAEVFVSQIDVEKKFIFEQLNHQYYCALTAIQTILKDTQKTDFDAIEEIVKVFEDLGSDCGARHDF